MSIIVFPYKKGLNSTKMMRQAGCKVRYATSTVRKGTAISWGNHHMPPWGDNVTWINHPSAIGFVANKLRWAELGYGPTSTQSKAVARAWANKAGAIVMCRTKLNASGGAGIVVARQPDEVVQAPLYTKYFRKTREYRIVYSARLGMHYVASKRLRADVDLGRDALLIRTADSGFVYQVEHGEIPPCVLTAVDECAAYLAERGLNILGYDVAYNGKNETALVIEANSAWGMNDYSGPIITDALIKIGDAMNDRTNKR